MGILSELAQELIPRKIGIAKGHLVISKDRKVYYIDIATIVTATPRTLQGKMEFFEIAEGCELIDFLDIGNNETILMLTNSHH